MQEVAKQHDSGTMVAQTELDSIIKKTKELQQTNERIIQ